MKCEKCKTEMFTGWLENPIYRDEEECLIEMEIAYCPNCKTVTNSVLQVNM
jgi:hypothetical protein